SYWVAHEAIKAGRIGKVTWAHGSYNRNARICLFNEHQKVDPTAGPDKSGDDFVDWDMWLGHQWGLAPLLIAIAGANGEYPRRVNANGGQYIEKDGRDIPDTFLMTADYPSEWSLFLVSTLTNDAG